jgi:DNA-binding NtrC family response regulator
VTVDESLVERIGVALAACDTRLTVGSTPDVARRMLTLEDSPVCIVDRNCSVGAEVFSSMCWTDDLALCLRYSNRDELGYSTATYSYPRHAVSHLLRHLSCCVAGLEIRRDSVDQVLGRSSAITLVREQIRSVAEFSDVPVLILGETGTGKERVARALHEATFGAEVPFVAINCAAIPESLLESELFGHEAGAYTGARGVKIGLFESAGEGTIFLDEIGEMATSLQPKLLRVLESREFRRLGSNRTLKLRARVVSATNRNPWVANSGELRADLAYRLAGFTIRLPPLRERTNDVELLTAHFLESFRERYGTIGIAVSDAAMELLSAHDWPGNVRQLRAVVEHACIVCRGGCIGPGDIRAALGTHATPDPCSPPADPGVPEPQTPGGSGRLRDIERELILKTLEATGGNVSRSAKKLGIPRSTLRSKLKRMENG